MLQPAPVAIVIAATLIFGRLIHGIYFGTNGLSIRLRFYGMRIAQSASILAIAIGLLL